MSCCHMYGLVEGGEHAFNVDPTSITFGTGSLVEVGDFVQALGCRRVALMTDAGLVGLEHLELVKQSLVTAGIDFAIYDEVHIEPTDRSFLEAARFATEGAFDGFVSLGGGSVMDTCKAANLYATYPAECATYVNAPVGDGQPVPGPLKPHIACPTTSGTGSECTGIAVFDYLALKAKTGIASRYLKPTHAVIDPRCTYSLPANVVASSAFDVLSHALESYTARPYTARPASARPSQRPMSQGANPWSDLGCREALSLIGTYMTRAVHDAADHEAREQLMWAATLAGIAFGNSGVHIPHGMAYSVAGLVRDYYAPDYPQHEPMVPHGISVIVNAPAVFRFTAPIAPSRHLEAATWLGADTTDVDPQDAGTLLSSHLIQMMQACAIPNGLHGVGYNEGDIPALTAGGIVQKRLLNNAPCDVTEETLSQLYHDAIRYW